MDFDPGESYGEGAEGAGKPRARGQFLILIAGALVVATLIAVALGVYTGAVGDQGTGIDAAGSGDPTATPSGTGTGEVPGPEEVDVDTDELVLRLSDVGPEYNFTGESIENVWEMSGDTQRRLLDRGVIRTHSRSFTLGDPSLTGERATIIISSVTVYGDEEAARRGLEREINLLREMGAASSEATIATGVNATGVTFENDRGLKSAALYGRDGDVVFSVTASARDAFYRGQSSELFLKMRADLE